MKAIIYCRVSTKEQAEQGYSLEAQEKECKKFAINNGYEVDRVFVDKGESAKTQNRPELQKLLRYIVENKKNISAIIFWKYDRLARNMADHTELIKIFGKLNISVLSVTEPNDNTSSGKFMRGFHGLMSEFENNVKSERTISGMKQAVKEGRWCWQAPIGYKESRDTLNKPLLVPADESQFIEEAFKLAESGLYKLTEIEEQLKKQGLKKITKNLLHRILRNSLYAGLIKVEWFPDYIKGIHKSIISEEQFFKVQQLLNGERPSITPKIRNNPDFPLRNFIRCPKCGQKLTGSKSTGRKMVRYAYYHCRTKGCPVRVKKQDLESVFYEYLKLFQPNGDTLELFEAIVIDVWNAKQQEGINEKSRLEKDLKELTGKKNRIDELMIKGTFDEETYKQKSVEINNEIMVKKIELNKAKIELNDIEACLSFCKYFLANIADLWANAELNLKQRFQTLVFPDKIYYEQETFRTTKTALIFKQLQAKSFAESRLVALMGFEPMFPP